MRTHILAAFVLIYASAASAQDVISPPEQPAPAATAPFDERAQWCDAYATWLVAIQDMSATRQQTTPADVRSSQRIEVEINSCKLDPQDYEHDTRAEAGLALATAQG